MSLTPESNVPNYRQIVPQEQWLQQTRADLNPDDRRSLAEHRPGLILGIGRFPVPANQVSWEAPYPTYNPRFIDEPYGRLPGEDPQ
jgi:hypothetical protein